MITAFDAYAAKARTILDQDTPTDPRERAIHALAASVLAYAEAARSKPTDVHEQSKLTSVAALAFGDADHVDTDDAGFPISVRTQQTHKETT